MKMSLEEIPSVIFAKKEPKDEFREHEHRTEQETAPRDNTEERSPNESDNHMRNGQEEPEMEQAILQLKSKQISSSAYKKIMMGLREVRIVDSIGDESDGGSSIDISFFKKEEVSSNEFDKVVQVAILSAYRSNKTIPIKPELLQLLQSTYLRGHGAR